MHRLNEHPHLVFRKKKQLIEHVYKYRPINTKSHERLK